MTTKYKIIMLTTVTVASFAFGRWSAPEKIKIETKTVEVDKSSEKENTDLNRDKHKKTIVKEVTKPDGTKEKTTEIVEDTETNKKTDKSKDTEVDKEESTSKEIVKSSSRLNISLLGGSQISLSNGVSLSPVVYGAHVSRNLLGPITTGLWGLNNGILGVSLGLEF